jgi:hypothetical protein
MDARRALISTNDVFSLRPLVVLAIRMMAPGRRRVEMVKLAHDMNNAGFDFGNSRGRLEVLVDDQPQAVPPQRRAA